MKIISLTLSGIFLWGLILLLGSSRISSSFIKSISGKDIFLPPLGKLVSPHGGFWKNAESAGRPHLLSQLKHPALKDEVTILFDERLVPHIFAKNSADAFFAQGFVTASLRLWQMEFQTHAISGRLTEILGTTADRKEKLLSFDLSKRRQGLCQAAKKSVELWKKDPKSYAYLEAYSQGVNAFIESLQYAQLPIEYKILDYKPEPWSVYKSALLLKAMAEDLVSKDLDFQMTNAYKFFGPDKFKNLYPGYFPEQIPIITDSTAYQFTAAIKSDSFVNPYQNYGNQTKFQEISPKGIGSNNWAIGPSKSISGSPILCNDPHLGLNLPSIWFEIQMVSNEFNTYGASLPGAPGVISGFNRHIAWGVTNVSHDVKDWYAIQWKDETKKYYLLDGKYVAAKIVLDTIKSKDGDIWVDTIRYTHWGPVAQNVNNQDFALYWLANEAGQEPLTFLKLMKGKNYNDYVDAIQYFSCPAQNIVFASQNGDIALWTQGKLPVRKTNQGKFVMDGSILFNQYDGFIPQNHIPHELNPGKGFVESANQHSVSPKYPYEIYGYFEEYRGRFLHKSLTEIKKADIIDMLNLQKSNFGQKAADFLPLFLAYLEKGKLNKDELEILALFKGWNYVYDSNSKAATVFEDWYVNLNNEIYDEIVWANEKGMDLIFPDEWHLLSLFKRDTGSFIIDKINTDTREKLSDIVTQSFKKTTQTVPKKNKQPIEWREMKATALFHLAKIKEFSVTQLDVPGTYHALNAVSNRYDFENSRKEQKIIHKDKSSSGPSWKLAVELGKTPKAKTIYPGGQSGNPGSFYYKNMVQDWAEGKYYDAHFLDKAELPKNQCIHIQKLKNY